MPYSGLLKKVYDNTKHWGLVIEVDEHGERKFNLWDKKYAGLASGEHEAICDVHGWEGVRVVFEVTKGKPKNDGTDDHWPSVIDSIRLEDDLPHKTVREMAEEIEAAEKPLDATQSKPEEETDPTPTESDEAILTRLQLNVINAQASLYGEVRRQLAECRERYAELARKIE